MKQQDVTEMPGFAEMMEKLMEGLPLERRLAGLAPEQRLVGLDRDHQALALPIEILRALDDAYIRTLSPETQEEIRRRLHSGSH